MTVLQAAVLGLVQGGTEFLPVSSSGHLVLVPWLLGWPIPGLGFDLLVHLGTAVAVAGYFWRDWLEMVRGAVRALRTRSLGDPAARLAVFILLGTVPGAVVGGLLENWIEQVFTRPDIAAGFLLLTAGILTLAEGYGRRERGLDSLSWQDTLLVGTAQAGAILPGISRSGATIAAGMARGLDRPAAARFSFLLSTPIILGAGAVSLLELVRAGGLAGQLPLLLTGFIAALVAGLACIHLLLRHLQRHSLYPFAVYCALFGLLGLVISLF